MGQQLPLPLILEDGHGAMLEKWYRLVLCSDKVTVQFFLAYFSRTNKNFD